MNDSPNRPPAAVSEQLQDLTPDHWRAVLQYFHGHPTEAATVGELGAFVRDLDPPDEGDSQVATRLHHATLPRLAANGLIDYDPRSNTARYRGRPPNDE